jgi:hypothetical protein
MNNIDKKIKLGILITGIILGIGFSVYFLQSEAQLETYSGPLKALIIDQLYDEMPNANFHTMATEYLQKAGYTVDIVTTKDVTVDFYKKLPTLNYKYVVVRTHGAENTEDVVLFTGERYSEKQYIQEQLFGQIKKATPLREIAYKVNATHSSDWVIINETTKTLTTSVKSVDVTKDEYFAIGPNLVNNGMNGRFDKTIFVLGGCNTLSNPSLADSLINRGASVVLGWDNTVGSFDNDNVMLYFLKKTLVENLEVGTVLEELPHNNNQESMVYPATFTSYPQA